MRKPRDFDSELKALADKARQLKERRVPQLGELVIATGADAPDATDAETLAGALLVIAEASETQMKEAWCKRGAAFFQSKARKRGDGIQGQPDGTLPLDSGAPSSLRHERREQTCANGRSNGGNAHGN